jgi:hypothetical protein
MFAIDNLLFHKAGRFGTWIWAVLLILATALFTCGYIMYRKYQEKRQPGNEPVDSGDSGNRGPTFYKPHHFIDGERNRWPWER